MDLRNQDTLSCGPDFGLDCRFITAQPKELEDPVSLYRFKSRETGDLVMLHPDGKRILEVLGKDPEAPGIIQATEMPAAIEKLHAAADAEEARQAQMKQEAAAAGDPEPEFESVSLRMRMTPFIEMLQRCMSANVEVVWGV